MTDKIIRNLLKENQKLRNEIIMLKSLVKSFKIQIKELQADSITQKAIQRGRP